MHNPHDLDHALRRMDPVVVLFEALYFAHDDAIRRTHLRKYLETSHPARSVVVGWLLLGPPRVPVRIPRLKAMLCERISTWQLQHSQKFIGDLAECIAALWPGDSDGSEVDWECLSQRMKCLEKHGEWQIADVLDGMCAAQRWLFLQVFVKGNDWKIGPQVLLESLPPGVEQDPALEPLVRELRERVNATKQSPRRSWSMVLMYGEKARGRPGWLHWTLGLKDAQDQWLPIVKVEPGWIDELEAVRVEDWMRDHASGGRGPIVEFEKKLVVEVEFVAVRSAPRRKCGIALEQQVIRGIRWGTTVESVDDLDTFLRANPVEHPSASPV